LYLKFELASYPLSLFNDNSMRKTNKAALESTSPVPKSNAATVIDCGFLLRIVPWERENYSVICKKYVSYVERNYRKNCSIVFDGYKNITLSTKAAEHKLQYQMRTGKVIFEESTLVTV